MTNVVRLQQRLKDAIGDDGLCYGIACEAIEALRRAQAENADLRKHLDDPTGTDLHYRAQIRVRQDKIRTLTERLKAAEAARRRAAAGNDKRSDAPPRAGE
ncbi:MAG TPA: hypothetical protein VFA78_02435 [Chloroflexota bacterium]|nr:hypothetical protein [Chloroflexota bacterium]